MDFSYNKLFLTRRREKTKNFEISLQETKEVNDKEQLTVEDICAKIEYAFKEIKFKEENLETNRKGLFLGSESA